MSGLAGHYTDAHTYLPEAGCITWVRDGDFEEVVRRIGGDPGMAYPATFDEVDARNWDLIDEEDQEIVLASRHGEWTVFLRSSRGGGAASAKSLSAGGEALSFAWTADGVMLVTYARDGQVVAMFDPADLNTMNPESGREWLAAVFPAPERWPENRRASVLALGEELSGVRLDREWRHGRHLAIPLGGATPPAPREPEPFRLEDWEEPYALRDPRVTTIMNDPSPERYDDVIHLSIEIALGYATPGSELEREALRVIASGVRDERSERIRADLRVAMDQAVERRQELEKSWPDPGVDFAAYLECARHPDIVRENKAAALLHVLHQALDPDRAEAARRTPEELSGLELDIDDNVMKNVLSRLAFWIAHGVNP
ncbi:hypothetical protein GCM10010116_49350 [Microbispora rosea subsp. aerata]|nr:DUF6461 domain-containing protein [Microbispora rosea]GGO24526.1 hypothetical protein GCM10010116_49350 [Microbispora rosea subsp. aerata]GIH58051.1 hypothetical protein Mro02_49650 [Microbispora rosea subsp. aerata]GLJ85599.1 hypothetical protein GCM10017588_43320 [Microbispora rosea subsp. aerata]